MKPKRWIERIRVTCRDFLHQWLMEEFGFCAYMAQAMWSVKTLDDITAELRLEFLKEIQRRKWMMKLPDTGRDEIHIRGKTKGGEVVYGKYIMWITEDPSR